MGYVALAFRMAHASEDQRRQRMFSDPRRFDGLNGLRNLSRSRENFAARPERSRRRNNHRSPFRTFERFRRWPAICTKRKLGPFPEKLEDAMAEQTEREVLHHLIEICKDGERGFRAAAEHVNAAALKSLFADLSAQRKQFAEELEPHLYRLGGLPDGGTNAGALHRGWMVFRGFVPGRHDHAIVVEAERGEHAALNAYKDALNGMLPPTVTDLVEAQRDAIRDANERIHEVELGDE
jgi:uncharacterized protein (TIGR02284 family)